MARRVALGVIASALAIASSAGAQESCRTESVPYDSVQASLLGALRAIRFPDTAAARFDQVATWLDSLRAKLPLGFA